MSETTRYVTPPAAAQIPSDRNDEYSLERPVKCASTTPTVKAARPASAIETSTAVDLLEPDRNGASGMNAPIAKVTKEAIDAWIGEPSADGSMPSSSLACVESTDSGEAISSTTTRCATSGETPRCK